MPREIKIREICITLKRIFEFCFVNFFLESTNCILKILTSYILLEFEKGEIVWIVEPNRNCRKYPINFSRRKISDAFHIRCLLWFIGLAPTVINFELLIFIIIIRISGLSHIFFISINGGIINSNNLVSINEIISWNARL